MRKLVVIVLGVLCIMGAFFWQIPEIVDHHENKVLAKPPYKASTQAFALHEQLTIVDLHADSLLWGRDLLASSTYGHVDIPRLADGNVALQVFSLPTKAPHGLNIQRNDDKSDDITQLAMVERWPRATWYSLTERALYQAHRLHEFADASRGGFVVFRAQPISPTILRGGKRMAGSPPGCFRLKARMPWMAKWKILTCCTARATA